MFLIILLISLSMSPSPVRSNSILSTCSHHDQDRWNNRDVEAHLRSWLKSITTLRKVLSMSNVQRLQSSHRDDLPDEGVMSMRYYPLDGEFGPHYEGEFFGELEETPAKSDYNEDNNNTDITEGRFSKQMCGIFHTCRGG